MEHIEKSFVQRRGWPRTIIDKVIDEAQLLLPTQLPQDASHAEIVNLSNAGAGVLMPMRFKKGAQVKLQILGKEVPSLDLEAEVRWAAETPVSTGKYALGLKFLQLDEERQTKLQGFIEAMQKHRPPSE